MWMEAYENFFDLHMGKIISTAFFFMCSFTDVVLIGNTLLTASKGMWKGKVQGQTLGSRATYIKYQLLIIIIIWHLEPIILHVHIF